MVFHRSYHSVGCKYYRNKGLTVSQSSGKRYFHRKLNLNRIQFISHHFTDYVGKPPRHDMDVQMVNRLPRNAAMIDPYRKTVRRKSFLELLRCFLDSQKHKVPRIPPAGPIRFRRGSSVSPSHGQGALGFTLENSQSRIALVNDVRRNFAFHYFAEQAIHLIHYSTFSSPLPPACRREWFPVSPMSCPVR